MKKIFFLLLLSLLSVWKANAQITAEGFKEYYRSPQYRDSLKQKLIYAGEDSSKAELLGRIAFSYSFLNSDSAVYYEREALELSKKINYKIGEEYSLQGLCFSLSLSGNFAGALDFGMKALSLSETMKDTALITGAYGTLMNSYVQQDDYKQALKYGLKAELFSRSSKVDLGARTGIVGILGEAYQNSGQLDSGLYYCLKAQQLNLKLNLKWGGIYLHLGDIYFKKGVTDSAMYYYRTGLPIAEYSRVYIDVVDIYYGMSKVFELVGKIDSSVYYAQKSIVEESILSYPEGKLRAATQLAHLYDIKGLRDSTIKYLKLSFALRENLFSREKTREAQNFAFNEQIHQQELQQKTEQDKLEYRNRLNVYILLAGLVVLLLVAVGLWRRNVFRRKSFAQLQKQKHETDNQKVKVEKTLEELRNTQAQLIQSEKMASLGELTAGIAHEIQNPLNFVNNFSEVNSELIAEMKEEIEKGNIEEVRTIANDIADNEQKINHHGKRADAIVKGMLQHSRSSSGVKNQPTSIHWLMNTYDWLIMAYGQRIKLSMQP